MRNCLSVGRSPTETPPVMVGGSTIKLLLLHNLPRHLYTLHGLHLNRKGEENSQEIKSITDIPSSSIRPPPTTDHGMTVTEATMWDMIGKYETDSAVGCSHTVSAGVAVVLSSDL